MAGAKEGMEAVPGVAPCDDRIPVGGEHAIGIAVFFSDAIGVAKKRSIEDPDVHSFLEEVLDGGFVPGRHSGLVSSMP